MPYINIHAATRYLGSEDVISIEVPDDKWDEMDEPERFAYGEDLLGEYLGALVDSWVTVSDVGR